MTVPHARVTPAWFFCGQSAVRSLSQSVSRVRKNKTRGSAANRKLVEGLLLVSADERPAAIIDAIRAVNRLPRERERRRASRS
jgi:hypothetical protein